jgi:hypothetical protein
MKPLAIEEQRLQQQIDSPDTVGTTRIFRIEPGAVLRT